MLVPFEINQTIVTKYNVPSHIVDWHRVRILKEIDDIRFRALSEGNIDLSLDALKSLKLFRLCILANPTIDSNGFVTNIDPVSFCYDITKEEIVVTLNEFFQRLKKALGTGFTSVLAFTYFDRIRNFKAKLMRPNIVCNRNAINQKSNLNPESMLTYVNSNFMNEANVYAWIDLIDATPNSASMVGIWPLISVSTASTSFMAAPINLYKDTFLSQPSIPVSSVISLYSSYGYAISSTASVNQYATTAQSPYDVLTTDGNVYTSYNTTQGVASSKLYVDADAYDFPVFMKAMAIEADVSAYVAVNSLYELTIKYFSTYYYSNGLGETITYGAPTVVAEVNKSYSPTATTSRTVELLNSSNQVYTYTVKNNVQLYPIWFKTITFTLQNGKVHKMPIAPMIPNTNYETFCYAKNPSLGTSKYAPFNFIKIYAEANKALYSFPLYYPAKLDDGNYQMRNGYLYADASNFYELAFYTLPDSTIDKIGTIIFAQDCIASLKQDIAEKFYTTELTYETKISSTGASVSVPRYATFYWEFGVKREFVHPVSLKPVVVDQYLNELYFTMITAWGEVDKEIKAFLEPLKIKNDASYQKAYNNYLMGVATMKGPEALAEYQTKLATGIFYSQNGFDYWRAFTPLEMQVITQLKEEAMLNKSIADQNAVILSENARYLELVNQAVLKQNQEKIDLAKVIAFNQLKQIADADLMKIVAPTRDYLIKRAEIEGGLPTDILNKWVQENPYYYVRSDLAQAVDSLLSEMTAQEQKITTALVADKIAALEITKALQELFNITG